MCKIETFSFEIFDTLTKTELLIISQVDVSGKNKQIGILFIKFQPC